jgi:putative SOS response-associated peptidase YedK
MGDRIRSPYVCNSERRLKVPDATVSGPNGSDPFGDAQHHHALDPKIAVRRPSHGRSVSRSVWNVAPTDQLPVLHYDRKAGERSLDLLRWGLGPYWAKGINVGFANINAKAEGIETRPAFREAF